MRLVFLSLIAALVLGVTVIQPPSIHAASPGMTVVPLLSCANVDGSADNGIRVADILLIVQAYFHDYPNTNYVFMYDLANPYNPETGTGGQQRVDDILSVVGQYFHTCPTADTQVAQATQWALDTDPNTPGAQPVPILENPSALAALGYVGISTIDVPGQGVHYAKPSLWDGTFNPAAPEGLVYDEGRLAAQLYVVNGADVGWLTEDPLSATPGPCGDGIDNGNDGAADGADSDCLLGATAGAPPDDVNIDPFAYCGAGVACSWATNEGWHLHYRLCIVHVGTPYAHFVALPTGQGQAQCDAIQNAAPNAGAGSDTYFERMGWMGHLWNWLPNANRVPDVDGSMNGRYADCFPDTHDPDNAPTFHGWKAYNCPQ